MNEESEHVAEEEEETSDEDVAESELATDDTPDEPESRDVVPPDAEG